MSNKTPAPPSPLPWTVDRNFDAIIVDDHGLKVADCGMTESESSANAALIVEAVNTHATLQAENAGWDADYGVLLAESNAFEIERDKLRAQVETLTTQLAERSRQWEAAVALLRRCGPGEDWDSPLLAEIRKFIASGEGAVTP